MTQQHDQHAAPQDWQETPHTEEEIVTDELPVGDITVEQALPDNPHDKAAAELAAAAEDMAQTQPGDLSDDMGVDPELNEAPAEEPLFIPPVSVNEKNFERYVQPFSVDKVSFKLSPGQILSLPGVNRSYVSNEIAEHLEQNVDDDDLNEDWQLTMMQAAELYPRADTFLKSLQRVDGDWASMVPHEDLKLTASRPSIGKSAQGQALTGAAAMARMAAYTSLGTVLQVPMWRSGFWITLKAPSDGALMELERRMMLERMVFGRLTRGMTYSQSEVHIKAALVDFLLSCVVETTLWSDDPQDIAEALKLADINTLIWGGALAIYPNGYPYVQPCTAQPAVCSHQVRGKVALHRLLFVDNNMLSEKQRRHMARRKTRITKDEYAAYAEEFAVKESSRYEDDGIGIRFCDPTYAQYRDSGFEWVAELEAATESAFGNRISIDERIAHVNNMAKAVAMRQYSHWVSRITFLRDNGEDDGYVESRKDINAQLEMMTGNAARAKEFFERVDTYIAENAVSVIGIPNYVCPKCRKRQPTAAGRFEEIIPIEVGQAFFTLTTQRAEARKAEESI